MHRGQAHAPKAPQQNSTPDHKANLWQHPANPATARSCRARRYEHAHQDSQLPSHRRKLPPQPSAAAPTPALNRISLNLPASQSTRVEYYATWVRTGTPRSWGTGIVANAAVSLPGQFPALRFAAAVVWGVAAVALTGLTMAWAGQWIRHRPLALGHAKNPTMAQFYGAPPMAFSRSTPAQSSLEKTCPAKPPR